MCFPVQARLGVLTTPADKTAIFEEPQNHVPAFRAKSNVPVARRAIRIQGDRLVVHFEGVYAVVEIGEVD
jgi:hypothetical protein